METAVLDEDLVGVHAGHQDARQIHALAVALERFGIGVGPLGRAIEAIDSATFAGIAKRRPRTKSLMSSAPVGMLRYADADAVGGRA